MNKHIPSLNGLRAVSIFMVIASHLKMSYFFGNGPVMRYSTIFIFNGQLGVNIFFIISGYLITSLLINEQNKTGEVSLKNFYLRRVLRIFPAYYFLLVVLFCLEKFNYLDVSWLGILTYTSQFDSGYVFETSHLWSLSVEEFFYLLWPFIFIKARHNLVTITLAGILFTTLARLILNDFPYSLINNTIFSTADALLIGCLVALKYEQIVYWTVDKKSTIYIALGCLVFSILTYIILFYLDNHYWDSKPILHYLTAIEYSLLGNIGLVTNLSLAVILVYSINQKNAWFDFLNQPFLNHIGKLSYSLYLYQQIFTANRPYLHKMPLILLILIIYLVASMSYNIIEKPFLKLKSKFSPTVLTGEVASEV